MSKIFLQRKQGKQQRLYAGFERPWRKYDAPWCFVDQALKKTPALKPSNFERVVAKFGKD